MRLSNFKHHQRWKTTLGGNSRTGIFQNLLLKWSGRPDLNRGPPAPKAGALPGCATPRHNCSTDSKPLPKLAKTRALAKAFVLLCFCSKLCQNFAKTHQFTLAVS